MAILTRSRRRLPLAALMVLAVATLTLLPIGAGSASAPTEQSAGVLLLSVDSDGDSWVRYYPDADSSTHDLGPLGSEQAISISNKCAVSTDGSLLSVASTGGSHGVGAVSNGLGVRTKNNCSTANGRIGGAQSLTLALGTDFSAHVSIKSVEVDVEGKFNADLGFLLDGTTAGTAALDKTSDNGPDAGVGDNNLVTIAPTDVFKSIEFSAVDGEIAIEGGGDGIVSGGTLRGDFDVNETLFELTTQAVACGDTLTTGDAEETPQATFVRGDDNKTKPGGECEEMIGATLTSEVNGMQVISFQFEEDELPSWFGEFVWVPEPAVLPVPATQIDADDDGTPEGDLLWCDGFTEDIDPITGLLIPQLPDGADWCMTGQQTAVVSSGLIQVTQQVYGLTDPNYLR